MRTVDEIDALLAAPKAVFGAPVWAEDGAKALLAAPITDARGGVIGGLSLRLWALIHLPTPTGAAILVLDGQPVQRLSFRPGHPHVNAAREPIPPTLRRLKLPADRSRLYRWSDDRLWPRPDKAGVAAPIDPEPATLVDAFALFLSRCAIGGTMAAPPHRPTLEFPK